MTWDVWRSSNIFVPWNRLDLDCYVPHRCEGCLVQVGNGIELDTVGHQFKSYLWSPCDVTREVVPTQ